MNLFFTRICPAFISGTLLSTIFQFELMGNPSGLVASKIWRLLILVIASPCDLLVCICEATGLTDCQNSIEAGLATRQVLLDLEAGFDGVLQIL